MSLSIYLTDPTATYEVGSLYDCNITHNLTTMADKAGIYNALWHPEEITKSLVAGDLIEVVTNGLIELHKRPDYFKKFDDEKGWGTYEDFWRFVSEYLDFLTKYPLAKIEVSR